MGEPYRNEESIVYAKPFSGNFYRYKANFGQK